MIRVTVELIPATHSKDTIHLGTAIIANDGQGTTTTGNYDARFSKRGQPRSIWKTSKVIGFPRQRLGAWDLLYCALREAVGSRNP